MKDCPKYDTCSAPICPLDPDWRLRAHNPEDRVCPYLLESVKADAAERLRGLLLARKLDTKEKEEELGKLEGILTACSAFRMFEQEWPSNIRATVARASKSPSRMEQASKRMRALRAQPTVERSDKATFDSPAAG